MHDSDSLSNRLFATAARQTFFAFIIPIEQLLLLGLGAVIVEVVEACWGLG